TWINSILGDEELANVEHKSRVTRYNFGPLWTQTENAAVFGFIGDNYQRLRIKIISATKNPRRPDIYTVTGKTLVRNVVRAFTGTMKLNKARVYTKLRLGIDDEYRSQGIKEHGVVIGEYHFSEDRNETNTGSFDGVFATYWYVDRNGRLKYDDVEAGADGFLNNQFVGTWTSYRNKASKIANWGDYRIPLSGELDMGAGEFSPDDKYLPFGWKSYRDAYHRDDKRARLEEERKWWR
ncbi:MAG TPA: hypothetical protein VFZ23_09575, partial [Pyrinomonadaceae bacterium]